MRTDFPRALIIGQPFNNDTGGGITLSNLCNGWPASKLAVACSAYEMENNIDTGRCTNYYQLGSKEDRWMFPFSLFKRKYDSGPVSFRQKEKYSKSIVPKTKARQRLISGVLQPLLMHSGLQDYVSSKELSNEFCSWLDDYDPDVIYIQASSLPDVVFSIAVHDYLRKPMVFHMMDDWPSLIRHEGVFKSFRYRKLDTALRKLLGRCSLLLSISDSMSEVYKQRYGLDFVAFHNPIDLRFWKEHERTNYALSEAPEVLYAGRTGLGIDSSLQSAAKAITIANQNLKRPVTLVLQTSEKPFWTEEFDCVIHREFVPYDELPAVFAQADLLLLPYDFSTKSIKYIKLSMPTKASEFMACGTPILVFAPLETAVAKYAQNYQWAKVVGEDDVDQLAIAFEQLFSSEEERRFFGTNGRRLAENRHDVGRVARTFQDLIKRAITRVESIPKTNQPIMKNVNL